MGKFLTSAAAIEQLPKKGTYKLLNNELFQDNDGSIYLAWRGFKTDNFTWINSSDWDIRCAHGHDVGCMYGEIVRVKLTEKEEKEMLDILEQALQQGAAGISLGLMYDPGLYADTDELKKIAKLCEKYNRPLTVHPRASSAVSMSYPELLGRSHLLRAVDELADVVSGTKTKLHYSHAIFVGRRSFKDKDAFLEIVDRLRKQGIDMMFDIYNETLGVSVITVILPAWYQAMTPEERKTNLKDAFMATADFSGKRVLLVDDIFTTGTTCNECAKVLYRAGAKEVMVFSLSVAGTKER